jgi:hypothetical protein
VIQRHRRFPVAAGALLALPFALFGQTSVLTWHNDAARTGQNLLETLLTPTNVNAANFGKLFTLPVDGKADGQPLYVPSLTIPARGIHNVLFVVSEHDSVYAFDADTGASLWQESLLLNGEQTSDDRSCSQVTPEIGITSTPAIDLTVGAHGTIYVVAMSKDGSNNYHQRLHALDLTTGAETLGGPLEVQATFPSTGPQSSGGVITFDPKRYKERAALLISNGILYTSWASHCDIQPYSAWIIGYDKTSLAKVSVLNLTPNGNEGSVWQAGAGLATDPGGSLFFLMANGTFDTKLNPRGFPSKGDFGNAFMNVSTSSGLSVTDYFTMHNTVSESNGDVDLGSGGAMVLPTLNDALGNPRLLAVGAGKDGTGYVVDRNNMGQFHSRKNVVYQQIGLGGRVFSSPAWFNNTLYYGAVGGPLMAFPFAGGSFSLSPSSTSPSGFGYPGTTPSISANGLMNGIVWAAENQSPAVLHAYDASNLSHELYNSDQAPNSRDQFGDGNKYITPTVANGKVYVGTTNGVGVFGLLNCAYSIASNSEHFNSGTGGDDISVTASNGCAWSVVNNSNFIDVTAGTSGTGNGTVSFTVPADPGVGRTGTLTIAGKTFTITQDGDTITTGLAFFPLPPCRIADTRTGSGFSSNFGAPGLTGGAARSFPIPASSCNVPATAQAYSLNVTVAPPAALQSLTAWPTGVAIPATTTLSSPNGQMVTNAAIVKAGTNGAVSFQATDDTNVIIDVNGYFAPPTSAGLAFYPLTPCRIADTRTGSGFSGAFGPPVLAPNSTRKIPVLSSNCDIPATAKVYAMRITALPRAKLADLTAWPFGQAIPQVPLLSAPNGGVVGNEALGPAGKKGAINVFVSNKSNVVIDIDGYFAPAGNPGALYFYPVTPCRVADTRSGSAFNATFGPPSLVGAATRDFPLPDSDCGIPQAAQAYALNLTVAPSGALGFLTAWPAGQTLPLAWNVNAPATGLVGAGAIVPAASDGSISVSASDPTDLLIDVNGYFAP